MVQGNSGTGKTTLFDMVSAYSRLKERSGVQIICDKQCVALHSFYAVRENSRRIVALIAANMPKV